MITGWKVPVVSLAALTAAAVPMDAAQARAGSEAPFMAAGEIADAPTGFNEMCARDRVLCDAGITPRAAPVLVAAPAPAPLARPVADSRPPAFAATCDKPWANLAIKLASEMTARANTPFAKPLSPTARADVAQIAALVQRRALACGIVAPTTLGVSTAHVRFAAFETTATATPALPEAPETMPDTIVVEAAQSAPQPDARAMTKMIDHINNLVNHNVIQVSDLTSSGVPEFWRRAGTRRGSLGDCEDIAIEKRMELIDAGFPPSRLFLAVAFSPRYGMHTLLIAHLDDGDYALDSLSAKIVLWSKTPYVFVRRQSADNPRVWRRVGSKTVSLVASTAPAADQSTGS